MITIEMCLWFSHGCKRNKKAAQVNANRVLLFRKVLWNKMKQISSPRLRDGIQFSMFTLLTDDLTAFLSFEILSRELPHKSTSNAPFLWMLQALETYQALQERPDHKSEFYVYAAACYYYMGLYKEAKDMAEKVSP